MENTHTSLYTLALICRERAVALKALCTYGEELNFQASVQGLERQLSQGLKCSQEPFFPCWALLPHSLQMHVGTKSESQLTWLILLSPYHGDSLRSCPIQFICLARTSLKVSLQKWQSGAFTAEYPKIFQRSTKPKQAMTGLDIPCTSC